MKTSQNGISFIKNHEGLRLKAYSDVTGVKTIGYGHTGKNLPDTITESQANAYLYEDIERAEKQVNKYGYSYNQNQFDALVSFAFNIGNIDELTQNGCRTLAEIKNKMPAYCHAGGKQITGLVNRRLDEVELFSKTDSNETTGIKVYDFKKEGNIFITKNFQVKEFIAKSSPLRSLYENGKYSTVLIGANHAKNMQRIRDKYGKATIVTSGYRPTDYNRSVDGATSSYHVRGQGCDIVVDGVKPLALAKACQELGIKGIGLYPTFVHVDDRETKYYWKVVNGVQTEVKSFI